VIGTVDAQKRALIVLSVKRQQSATAENVTAWIDTAFDGHLVFSKQLINQLQLETLVETEAILADGTRVSLDTFLCYLDWFEEQIPVQVIANEGKIALLGTGLLDQRVLRIDYANNQLSVD